MQQEPYLLVPLDNAVERALLDSTEVRLLGYRWRVHTDGYACRTAGRRTVYLHREVLGLAPGDGLQVDHLNRNRLDNRRANLRVVVNAENCQNLPARSGYRGVYWHTKRARWMARVKLNYRHRFLGYHADELTAARAAEAFRRAHMPFAVPDQSLEPVSDCACKECLAREPRRAALIPET